MKFLKSTSEFSNQNETSIIINCTLWVFYFKTPTNGFKVPFDLETVNTTLSTDFKIRNRVFKIHTVELSPRNCLHLLWNWIDVTKIVFRLPRMEWLKFYRLTLLFKKLTKNSVVIIVESKLLDSAPFHGSRIDSNSSILQLSAKLAEWIRNSLKIGLQVSDVAKNRTVKYIKYRTKISL